MCTDVGQARPVMCEREIDAADIGVKFPVAIRMLGERKVGERTMDHQLTTRGMPALQAVGEPEARACLAWRSEEHTSELQSLMRISYAVFCLKNKKYYLDSHNT